MQSRLKNADVQDAFPQRDWRRVRGDKFADDLLPNVDHFGLMQTLAQSEVLHELWDQLSG
jgi:hypothetical protein